MATVAEGIETGEQLNELKGLLCGFGQGFLLSRPLDAAAFPLFVDQELEELPVIRALLEKGYPKCDRDSVLSGLKELPGIHPAQTITGSTLDYCFNQDRKEPVYSPMLTDKAEFGYRGLIEVSRSCLYRCAFCLVTNVYGDYYPMELGKLLECAERFRGKTDKLGLVAATLTNHPQFKEMIRELNRMDFRLSFSAFRIEGLDDELLGMIVDNENKTLTIAPETASERLKKLVQKPIPNSMILDAVRRACGFGIKRLKLYFLVGLPGETEADLDENIRLVGDIWEITKENAKRFGYLPEIIVDINPLVPKPLTPLSSLAKSRSSPRCIRCAHGRRNASSVPCRSPRPKRSPFPSERRVPAVYRSASECLPTPQCLSHGTP